ncbi:MAG: class II aldolase/adducin family protein [Pseudomonadota bacterium]
METKNCSSLEWQARTELAAVHRLCVHYGWENHIYNHIALRVPGEENHFLVKQHRLLFEEVTASNLMKLRIDGQPMSEGENVNAAGFTIHTAILKARPEINCTLHTHSIPGMAISAYPEGLLPLTQGSMRFFNRLSYHEYEGISSDADETARLQRDLGAKNRAMILRNHGLLTCGYDVSNALTLMKYLVNACEVQLRLLSTGCKPRLPTEEVCEHAAKQWEEHDLYGGKADWPAYVRIADKLDPSYRN